MDYARLIGAVCEDAALRRRQRLQPVAGKGDKIFPPTYPPSDEMKRLLGDRSAPPRHVFERRRVDGTEVWCVLVDGVQKPASASERSDPSRPLALWLMHFLVFMARHGASDFC